MCYQLVLVSPLTLSEVRSMLPPGTHADALSPAGQQRWRALLPGSQTAVLLRAGHCACGLLQPRFRAARTDEAHLRQRYRELSVPRAQVVRALERHRRSVAASPRAAPDALQRLVVEHARNAGPSAWFLGFSAHDAPPVVPATPVTNQTAEVVARDPDGWLAEGQLTMVQP